LNSLKENDGKLINYFRSYKDELKVSFSRTKSLGLEKFGKSQVQRSYSYIDLQYLKYIFDHF
jgi:hypothetical protein